MLVLIDHQGFQFAGELQRDWARQESAAAMAEVFFEHGGGTGIALAWELQLLAQKAGAGA